MSQQKKLELHDRIREFRRRIKLSQDEFGERLGVSGNYISMIELGKKSPGPSLRKLFESMEHSPLYKLGVLDALGQPIPPNPLLSVLSTEMLIQNFQDVAEKLPQATQTEQKQRLGQLREMLEELEDRLLNTVSSGEPSEAQRIAVKASRSGGSRGTK